MSRLLSMINRALFVGAFVLAGLAVLEKLANVLGYTVLQGSYEPSRLLEFAAMALLFVFALLLREIRSAVQTASRR